MKRIHKNVACTLVMLFSAVSLFGQNLPLIFQLTDQNNAALDSVEVKIIPQQNEENGTTLITDDLGRIVISSFSPGDYKYEINYGDYSTGSFSVAPGSAYAWINLDFRKATITLQDDSGNPLSGEDVNIYKVLPNGSDSLISTKKTGTESTAEFILLDKEKYSYTALLQKETFTMNGELNKNVSAQSAYALVSIYFGFKVDGEIVDVAAGNITVYRKNDSGQYVPHGESPAKTNPDNPNYNLFDSPVSCKPGVEYQAKVSTGKYGSLTADFTPYFNPAMGDTVYFSIKTKPGSGDSSGPGGGGSKPKFPTEWVEGEVVVVIINTVWKDTGEPVSHTPYLINGSEFRTGKNAADTVWVFKDSYCTVEAVAGDSRESFYADQDTTNVTLYYDNFYNVAFTFRLDGNVVYPSKINNFCISSDNGIYMCNRSFTILTQGDYSYSFSIDDFNYDGKMSGTFNIPVITEETRKKDTTIYIDIEKKKEVKFIVLNSNDQRLPFYTAEIFKYENGTLLPDTNFDLSTHTGFITDENGIFTDYLLNGDYQVAILDTLFNFSIQSDTTIILQRKDAMKNVYFRYLLDGKEVFPKVTQIDLSYPDNTNSFYIVSSFKQDEEGNEYSVFDQPAKCLPGEYVYSFQLTDMGFNGRKYGTFQTSLSTQQDTIIFIVLPIKPEVEITVLDKNQVPIRNVYGAIYKYNEDGTLNPDPFYDDFSHDMLKTSDNGVIWDKLLPGKYRYVMEDIVQRDFVVGEYDIKFQVVSGVDYYTTTFFVKDTKGNPVTNTLLEIRQGENFYGSNLTDENGMMKIENESGTYTYHLDYGNTEDGTYQIVKSDTTIYIVVEELVNAESIAVKGCRCLQYGESIQLFPEITPGNATYSEVHWSIDNQLYANISSKGILTANEVGLDGTVIITATAKDGSGVSGTKEVKIKSNCNDAKIDLSIGKAGVKDTTVAGGTLALILGETDGKTENPVTWFVYQHSTGESTWNNINTEPVQETTFLLNVKDYSPDETHYFRVIAAESEELAIAISGTEEQPDGVCISYSISTTAALNVVDIFQNWANSVCSSNAEVTLNLSKESLAIIEQAGTAVEWYKKTDEATGFVKVSVPQENLFNPLFTLTGKTTFKVRIVNKTENFAVEFEQAIDYISVSGFQIKASETAVCVNTPVELSISNAGYPAGSYKWFDGSEQPTVTVPAERKKYWAVLNACPKDTAKIELAIDDSLKISLKAGKELICETETAPVKLSTEITQGKAGTFTWSPGITEQTSSVSVLPGQTAQYKVSVKTAMDKCPAAKDSITIEVEEAIELTLASDNYDICQNDLQYITLSADVQHGTPTEYIWWDGEKTTGPQRTYIPTQTATYSVQAKGTACPLSGWAFTSEVEVAPETTVELSAKSTTVNFGEPAQLVATTGTPVTGTYHWYILEEGSETLLGETSKPTFEYFPTQAASYLVKVENGACPVETSLQMSIKLVDKTEIPTAFTPYDKDGLNDDFMPGYTVFIYDRYGNLICNSEDGWDGTYRGETAEAGVYIYAVTMKDDRVAKGTIEVVRLK